MTGPGWQIKRGRSRHGTRKSKPQGSKIRDGQQDGQEAKKQATADTTDEPRDVTRAAVQRTRQGEPD